MSLPQAVSRPQACRAPASHTRPPAPRSVPPSGPSLASVTAPGDHTQPWASCPGGPRSGPAGSQPTGRSRLPHLLWRPGEHCSARVPVRSRPVLWEGPSGLQPAPGLQPRCFILQTVGSPTWSQNPTDLKEEVPDAQWLVRGSTWEGRALLAGAGGGLRFVFHSLTCHSLSQSLHHLFTLLHTHSFTHSHASLQGRGPSLLLRKLLAESPQGGPPSPHPGSTRSAGTNRFLF